MISCLVDFTHSPLSSLKLFEHSSTKTSTSASSNQLHPPMQPPSSSSRRRMALSNCVSTTKDSTRYPRRTGILYPSSLTSLTPWVRRRSILKLILGMLTIWFASLRAMSGKLPSKLATAPMNGRWCLLASPMPQMPCSNLSTWSSQICSSSMSAW